LEKHVVEVNIVKERKRLILGLVLVTLAVNISIAFASVLEKSHLYYDLVRLVIIGSATILSLIVYAKQGYKGLFGRAYAALAVGLIMYLAAELVWAYYEIGINEETPFPSIADVFYLAGYLGFGYNQFTLFKFYGKGIKKSVYCLVIPIIGILAFLYLQSLVSLYGSANPEDYIAIALSVSYPVLDSIIFVPAILIILNSWKGQLTFVPWIFVSWVLSGAADILFGYMSFPEFELLGPIVTMIYNSAYLCMAAGLIWYLKFFIAGEKKILKF